MTTKSAAEQIADSAMMKAVSRVAMALAIPALGAVVWVGRNYVDTAVASIPRIEEKVDRDEAAGRALENRTSRIEQKVEDGQKSREAFQSQVLAAQAAQNATLDDMRKSAATNASELASIAATLRMMQQQPYEPRTRR